MIQLLDKKITIVMYHYVRDLKNSKYPEIKGLDVSRFVAQLDYMKKNYTVMGMEDLLNAYETGDASSLPEDGVLLTFDDGYMDHYSVVYPLLKKHGMTGAFFPNAMAVKEHKLLTVNRIHFILAAAQAGGGATGVERLVQDCFEEMDDARRKGLLLEENEMIYKRIAVGNRWDPAEVIFVKRLLQNELPEDVRTDIAKRLFAKYVGVPEDEFAKSLYMNHEQIREMKKAGMFFGIHGYDHYWLGKLPEDKMKEDIQQALEVFEDVVDSKRWVMNYPYGNYSDGVIQYIKNRGCVLGLTVEPRVAELAKDNPYTLPRLDTNDLPPAR